MHEAVIQDSVCGGKQHNYTRRKSYYVLGCSHNSKKRLDPTPRRGDTSCCGEVVRPYGRGRGVVPATADPTDVRSICVASRCDWLEWATLSEPNHTPVLQRIGGGDGTSHGSRARSISGLVMCSRSHVWISQCKSPTHKPRYVTLEVYYIIRVSKKQYSERDIHIILFVVIIR